MAIITGSGIKYVDRVGSTPTPEEVEAAKPKRPKREKAPKQKNDPRHVAMARELRDRFLEEVEREQSLILPHGKYEVSRQLEVAPMKLSPATPLLNAV